jgi:hypothetical protein
MNDPQSLHVREVSSGGSRTLHDLIAHVKYARTGGEVARVNEGGILSCCFCARCPRQKRTVCLARDIPNSQSDIFEKETKLQPDTGSEDDSESGYGMPRLISMMLQHMWTRT